MPMPRSSEARKASFEAVLPRSPLIARRLMFGFPATFVNGWFFAGVFAEDVVVRLPDGPEPALDGLRGAGPFAPMPGRPMKGWRQLSRDVADTPETLRELLEALLPLVAAAPPKEKPAKKSSRGEVKTTVETPRGKAKARATLPTTPGRRAVKR